MGGLLVSGLHELMYFCLVLVMRFSYFIGLLGICIASISTACASESANKRLDNLLLVYNYSGMHKQVQWVKGVVVSEVTERRTLCNDSETLIELDSVLADFESESVLKNNFIALLDERIEEQALAQLLDWMNTDLGKKINSAENADQPNDYDKAIQRYVSSNRYNNERKKLAAQLVKATGAAYFVSALHTELDFTITIASACSSEEKTVDETVARAKAAQSDEAFYRLALKTDLIEPTAFTYRDLTAEELVDFIEFAESEAGRVYHTALIQGIRVLLEDQSNVIVNKHRTFQLQ